MDASLVMYIQEIASAGDSGDLQQCQVQKRDVPLQLDSAVLSADKTND